MYKLTKNLAELPFSSEHPLFFDLETDGLFGEVCLVQFYQANWDCVYLVYDVDLIELIATIDKYTLVGHNLHYDFSTIQLNLGRIAWCPSSFEDTFFLSRLKYYKHNKFSLDKCISYALGKDVYLNSKNDFQKSSWKNPETLSKTQLEYAAKDVFYLKPLYDEVSSHLEDISYRLDIKATRCALKFQNNGISFDRDKAIYRQQDLINSIRQENLPINCNSSVQVRGYIDSIFSDDDGLAHLILKGSEKALKVRKVRKLTKEKSFIQKYLDASENSDRLYGLFSPSTISGRFSCKNDNLQQIPRKLLTLFSTKDNFLVYSDFSQIELRVVCSIAQEGTMQKLFVDKKDLHEHTAKSIFSSDKITSEQRQIAKIFNFSLIYGAGAQTLCTMLLQQAGIFLSYEEAEDLRNSWFITYPAILAWHKKFSGRFFKKLPGKTVLGRKYTPKRFTDMLNIQVQGTAADVAKLAMIYMTKEFDEQTKLVNFVHDSYVVETESDYKQTAKIICNAMSKAWEQVIKDVPMPVEVKVGKNWGELEQNLNVIYRRTENDTNI